MYVESGCLSLCSLAYETPNSGPDCDGRQHKTSLRYDNVSIKLASIFLLHIIDMKPRPIL